MSSQKDCNNPLDLQQTATMAGIAAQSAAHDPVDTGSKDINTTTSTGEKYIDRHTALLAPVFATDPVFRYMLSRLPSAQYADYQPKYMYALLRASQLNDGIFVQADNWSCAAVWMPPGKRPDNEFTIIQAGFLGVIWNLGIGGARKMLVEFGGQVDKLKKEFLVDAATGRRLKRYHYLWFIGTDVQARGRGLASHLIRKKQDEVRGDGLPIWLEATTARSRDVYAKSGFRTVGEVGLGRGTHASSGEPQRGGDGVTVYAMIWRPQWEQEKNDVEEATEDTAAAAEREA